PAKRSAKATTGAQPVRRPLVHKDRPGAIGIVSKVGTVVGIDSHVGAIPTGSDDAMPAMPCGKQLQSSSGFGVQSWRNQPRTLNPEPKNLEPDLLLRRPLDGRQYRRDGG